MEAIRNHRIVRFLFVGAINSTVGFSTIFLLLDVCRWGYWPSTVFGNVAGAIVSYFLNKKLTFKDRVVRSKTACGNFSWSWWLAIFCPMTSAIGR